MERFLAEHPVDEDLVTIFKKEAGSVPLTYALNAIATLALQPPGYNQKFGFHLARLAHTMSKVPVHEASMLWIMTKLCALGDLYDGKTLIQEALNYADAFVAYDNKANDQVLIAARCFFLMYARAQYEKAIVERKITQQWPRATRRKIAKGESTAWTELSRLYNPHFIEVTEEDSE